ncbi:hypothetical protein HBI56_133570 [Parastagonospora nodorum]|uniref:Uncharacterized protein n=1 Tax=Phaeosphaeria nodorum (strain SN15 / ATCC MYA-4574 / FGSC 10173) TaxID=321614 RepID=A0A7U2FBN8_PHANO|nr:hypothetical protein HBH56_036670 [Parastagonospora nodorum]QRD00010.1 hypothetical protein JI435_414380 [Parastagonospora nodorum SN15]KAH3933594.1 hypothetical protein HBH54_062800 [Parastagonospora nodorum]KAH3952652.1 hypothetical protein HBH53_047320 [Parastagonospora nodorum]KAH3979481.1 hypothetical protein HBH51_058320 [Parastagonospora nodorum]
MCPVLALHWPLAMMVHLLLDCRGMGVELVHTYIREYFIFHNTIYPESDPNNLTSVWYQFDGGFMPDPSAPFSDEFWHLSRHMGWDAVDSPQLKYS